LATKDLSLNIESHWIHTDSASIETLENYAAIWCVPASPYANTENVLNSIHYARSRDIPFLGTCGGYQHAALEFAKNSLGYAEADNAEINPATSMPLISGLACKLYDTKADVYLEANSRVSQEYRKFIIALQYRRTISVASVLTGSTYPCSTTAICGFQDLMPMETHGRWK